MTEWADRRRPYQTRFTGASGYVASARNLHGNPEVLLIAFPQNAHARLKMAELRVGYHPLETDRLAPAFPDRLEADPSLSPAAVAL
ncbi:hypothetical protein [Bradyrhizobium embrapense]|uniref:hypothetical protein n=1 Tax=Bradyrhizobium embrapense TaxID=630921 RepID=UPI00067CFCC5|nr:hypothetical protein [Bradyrhizobium embrapense]